MTAAADLVFRYITELPGGAARSPGPPGSIVGR